MGVQQRLTLKDIQELLEDQEVLDSIATPKECRICSLILLQNLDGSFRCPECDEDDLF